ncbi:uncharacterized protein LOC141673316 [Apium graveolens]|uniref:uncharacterized protein LOC141673316 n=1 Tax=Apium graveolens TaxID=4045 RepID=UPI003D7A80F0
MVHWNKAQLIHHLIRIVTNSGSVWASWVNKTVLKNRHFWIMDIPTDCSWIWRQVLKHRVMALWFITYDIVSGTSISLWFEPWWNSCCLANSVTALIISQCFLSANATVACVINSGIWTLPRPNAEFTTQTFYSPAGLRTIIFHLFIPVVVIIFYGMVWMLLKSKHGIYGPLFETQVLWSLGTKLYGIDFRVFDIPVSYHSWVEFLVSLTELEDKQKAGTIVLCYAQVYYYHIWRERNVRAHDKGIFGPSKLLQEIFLDVKARLSASGWYKSNRPDLDNFVRL